MVKNMVSGVDFPLNQSIETWFSLHGLVMVFGWGLARRFGLEDPKVMHLSNSSRMLPNDVQPPFRADNKGDITNKKVGKGIAC